MGRTHPNLVGHWRFENNLMDTSGNGNDGTVGAGSAAYAAGKIGRAWDSNATRWVVVPASDGFAGSQMTFAFWAKRTSWTRAGAILEKYFTASNQRGFTITEDNISESNRLSVSFSTNGMSFERLYSDDGFFENGVWIHGVVVFEAGAVRIYKNGVLFTSLTSTQTAIFNSNTALAIGRYVQTGTSFVGLLDEVCIYKAALAPHQIAAIYNGVDPAFLGDVA
jgi:hypothetical protein